jgi:3D (Asp-Asp-Asp) domain-containing protein
VGSILLVAASFAPLDQRAAEDTVDGWDLAVLDPHGADPGGTELDDSEDSGAADDVDEEVELSPGGAQCDPYACWLAAAPWAFTVSTSAYAWGCGASGPTRTGTRVRWGVVAVDPRVIPLGTQLEMEGFMGTTFVAEDTGSAVVGRRVDIYWPAGCAEARRYGRQPRAVRFVG